MISFGPTEEQEVVREALREFATEVLRPAAREADEASALPDGLLDQVWELDGGRLNAFRGNYTRYRAQLAERTERQRREYERQQEYIAREEAFIRRYKAGQRAREARGRETRLARLERIEAPHTDVSIRLAKTGVLRCQAGLLQH